jgi:hypothetical protein
LVQIAYAISHAKGGKLKILFNIKAKKGYLVAIIALAIKVLCIIHHLLVNQKCTKRRVIDLKECTDSRE